MLLLPWLLPWLLLLLLSCIEECSSICVLMLTLPNSGSTWFAKLVAGLPGCRYYEKEFFNPVCNLKHELVLRRNFGSELVSLLCGAIAIEAGGDDQPGAAILRESEVAG